MLGGTRGEAAVGDTSDGTGDFLMLCYSSGVYIIYAAVNGET